MSIKSVIFTKTFLHVPPTFFHYCIIHIDSRLIFSSVLADKFIPDWVKLEWQNFILKIIFPSSFKMGSLMKSKKISNDQELICSDPTTCPH